MKTTKILLLGAGTIAIAAVGLELYLYKKRRSAAQTQPAPAATVSSSTSPAITPVTPACQFPTGTLLRQDSSEKVYQVNANCERQWITSRTKFNSMGLRMEDVFSVPRQVMESIKLGADLKGLGNISLEF